MKDKKDKNSHGGHHMGLMMVGCLIMMGVLWFVVGTGAGGSLLWPLILLCPLMHILMMFSGSKKNSDHDSENDNCDEYKD